MNLGSRRGIRLVFAALMVALFVAVVWAGPPHKDGHENSFIEVSTADTNDACPDPEEGEADTAEFQVNPSVTCTLTGQAVHDYEIDRFFDCIRMGLSEPPYSVVPVVDPSGFHVVPPTFRVFKDGDHVPDFRIVEHSDDIAAVSIKLDRGSLDIDDYKVDIVGFVDAPQGGTVYVWLNDRSNPATVSTFGMTSGAEVTSALAEAIDGKGFDVTVSSGPPSVITVDWDNVNDCGIESIRLLVIDPGLETSELYLYASTSPI